MFVPRVSGVLLIFVTPHDIQVEKVAQGIKDVLFYLGANSDTTDCL